MSWWYRPLHSYSSCPGTGLPHLTVTAGCVLPFCSCGGVCSGCRITSHGAVLEPSARQVWTAGWLCSRADTFGSEMYFSKLLEYMGNFCFYGQCFQIRSTVCKLQCLSLLSYIYCSVFFAKLRITSNSLSSGCSYILMYANITVVQL